MSRMSIIAVATGARDDQAAIAAAADFAARHQSTAKVVAFVPVPIGPAISPRIGGAAVAAQVWESMEEQRDAVRARIGAMVAAEVQRLERGVLDHGGDAGFGMGHVDGGTSADGLGVRRPVECRRTRAVDRPAG